MKKIGLVVTVITMILIAGCNSISGGQGSSLPEYIPSSTDIVDTHGKIQNLNRLEEFIENIEIGTKDQIRIVRYTIEGDPILRDVEFDGKTIKSTTDTRRDQFGNGNITTVTCTSIEKVETNESTDYILHGCDQPIDDILLSVRL